MANYIVNFDGLLIDKLSFMVRNKIKYILNDQASATGPSNEEMSLLKILLVYSLSRLLLPLSSL